MDNKFKHLTFSEYVESKNKLRDAIKTTPRQMVEYTIRKYCTITTGNSRDDSEQINLKPNQKIIIEWIYHDIDNPIIKSISFGGVCESIDDKKYDTYWDVVKLNKWLFRNTIDFMR